MSEEAWYIEKNGFSYARVSSVLRGRSDFSSIPAEVLKNKQEIGRRVHEAIHDDQGGDFPGALEPSDLGYFESFQKWKKAVNPTFIESEKRYFHDEKAITGAIDALITFDGQELPVIVDFKTSANESKEVWPMQGHLYHFLVRSMGRILAPRVLFIKLDKNGSPPKVFDYAYSANTMALCMHAIDDFWMRKKFEFTNILINEKLVS